MVGFTQRTRMIIPVPYLVLFFDMLVHLEGSQHHIVNARMMRGGCTASCRQCSRQEGSDKVSAQPNEASTEPACRVTRHP